MVIGAFEGGTKTVKGDDIDTDLFIVDALTVALRENLFMKFDIGKGKFSVPKFFLNIEVISPELTLRPEVLTYIMAFAVGASVEYPFRQLVYCI